MSDDNLISRGCRLPLILRLAIINPNIGLSRIRCRFNPLVEMEVEMWFPSFTKFIFAFPASVENTPSVVIFLFSPAMFPLKLMVPSLSISLGMLNLLPKLLVINFIPFADKFKLPICAENRGLRARFEIRPLPCRFTVPLPERKLSFCTWTASPVPLNVDSKYIGLLKFLNTVAKHDMS